MVHRRHFRAIFSEEVLHMSVEKEKLNESTQAEQKPFLVPWLCATLEDATDIDFEAPIAGSDTADCHELSGLYRLASQQSDGSSVPPDTASNRIFLMLTSITGMRLKPNEPNEPFGAMAIFAEGLRSAIASDFRSHVELLADLARRATNPVLRARLSDVCWVLDRTRGKLALATISAYTDIVEK